MLFALEKTRAGIIPYTQPAYCAGIKQMRFEPARYSFGVTVFMCVCVGRNSRAAYRTPGRGVFVRYCSTFRHDGNTPAWFLQNINKGSAAV